MYEHAYEQLRRVVDGATRDAFRKHPDYLTPKGRRNAKGSVVKRVVGTVLAYAVQAAERQRELADQDARLAPSDRLALGAATTPWVVAGDAFPQPIHSHAYVEDRCWHAIRRALFPRQTRAIRKDAGAYQRAKTATTQALRRAVGE